MRVYKFLNAHFGLKSLYEKRLKISTVGDLNDPFDLLPFALEDQRHRFAAWGMRDELSRNRGVLCFSAAWHDPVIWAHYADKHKGICLGFEIDDEVAMRVDYRSERLPFPPKTPTEEDMVRMLSTKFDSWKYEQEIRVWTKLYENEDGIYYKNFDERQYAKLQLAEVISGAECQLPEDAFRRALLSYTPPVKLIKALAGFTKFEVRENLQGFLHVNRKKP